MFFPQKLKDYVLNSSTTVRQASAAFSYDTQAIAAVQYLQRRLQKKAVECSLIYGRRL